MELGCSLDANHNHVGTAFGGSLSALLILAAYCRIFQMMDGQGHVVLKNTKIDFMLPVKEDLRAICLPPSHEDSQEFLQTYEKKGRARLTLTSEIVLKSGKIAARLTGQFVGQP